MIAKGKTGCPASCGPGQLELASYAPSYTVLGIVVRMKGGGRKKLVSRRVVILARRRVTHANCAPPPTWKQIELRERTISVLVG